MIRLHSPFERIVMVSPERITHVKPDHERPERTRIYFGDDYIAVRESVEEVARKVLEWRLAMERYRAVVFAEAKVTGEEAKMLTLARDVEYRIMLNLAGLEEPT